MSESRMTPVQLAEEIERTYSKIETIIYSLQYYSDLKSKVKDYSDTLEQFTKTLRGGEFDAILFSKILADARAIQNTVLSSMRGTRFEDQLKELFKKLNTHLLNDLMIDLPIKSPSKSEPVPTSNISYTEVREAKPPAKDEPSEKSEEHSQSISTSVNTEQSVHTEALNQIISHVRTQLDAYSKLPHTHNLKRFKELAEKLDNLTSEDPAHRLNDAVRLIETAFIREKQSYQGPFIFNLRSTSFAEKLAKDPEHYRYARMLAQVLQKAYQKNESLIKISPKLNFLTKINLGAEPEKPALAAQKK